MFFLLEYNPETSQFHDNSLDRAGGLHCAMFSAGWFPVCVFPGELHSDPGFMRLLRGAGDGRLAYEDVCRVVVPWVMGWMEAHVHFV